MSRSLPLSVVASVAISLSTAPAPAVAGPQEPATVSPVMSVEASTALVEIPVSGIAAEALGTLDLPVVEEDGHDHSEDAEVAALGTDTADGDAGEVDGALVVLTPELGTVAFDVMGVTWDDPDELVEHVMVRTRDADGWTDWIEVPAVDGASVPDGAESTERLRGGTDVLVAAGSDGVQVRVQTDDGRTPDGLRLVLVDGGESTERAVAATAAVAESSVTATAVAPSTAADLRPAIVTRAQWGANEALRMPINWNSTIKAMYVHHTVNSNTYTQTQAPAIVRGIYEFHVKGRGWSDVGYNFLVDRFGTVYEGRAGSIDSLAQGVHTGGFNLDSMAVSAIGDFTSVVPSTAMSESIAQVIAWKLATYHRNPLGTVTLTAGSGSTHPVRRPGWTGPVDVISGHRDMASTACPGGEIHRRLPAIRQRVAQIMAGLGSTTNVTTRPYASGTVTTRLYTQSTTQWSVTVRGLCATTPARTWTGTGGGLRTVSWDLKNAAGAFVAPGVYEVRAERVTGGRVQRESHWVEVLRTSTSPPPACPVERLGGADRYATAAEIARASYPTGADVVIVNGTQESIVDGLVAAPFAVARNAPVLLSTASALPAATRAELVRRKATRVWLVGGQGVLGKGVVDELTGLGIRVERLSGGDRYGTAAAVARAMGASTKVVLASGNQANLIDAAAVSGPAAATARPILLTATGAVPSATTTALAALGARDAVVVGGEGVVAADVVSALEAAQIRTTRMGGANRYDTSVAVARGFATQVGTQQVLVASGADANLVDALTGGVTRRITVLTGPVPPRSVTDFLGQSRTTRLLVAGGPGVVAPSTVAAVAVSAGLGRR